MADDIADRVSGGRRHETQRTRAHYIFGVKGEAVALVMAAVACAILVGARAALEVRLTYMKT